MSLSFSNKLAIAITAGVIVLTFSLLIIFSGNTKKTQDYADNILSAPDDGQNSSNGDLSGSDGNSTSPNGDLAGSDSDGFVFNSVINRENDGKGIGGGCIMGDCSDGKRNLPIYCVNTGEKVVAISFDAAWGDSDTLKILDILDKHNVKTTFFMTGQWVEKYPEMVKEIRARGHDLGNHSQNHKQMSKLSVPAQIAEIQSVTDNVRKLTGYDMFLFRPPYGDYNNDLINTAYSLNYYPIEWSVDSLDWKDYGVNNIIKTVTTHKALGGGAIILMHNGAKFTADALDTVLTNLTEQGYTIVPISQLIILDNFHMKLDGTQLSD